MKRDELLNTALVRRLVQTGNVKAAFAVFFFLFIYSSQTIQSWDQPNMVGKPYIYEFHIGLHAGTHVFGEKNIDTLYLSGDLLT